MRNPSPSARRAGATQPLTMQDKTMAAVRGIVASAGLEAAEAWAYSNVGDLTVTRPGSFQPLFTIHVDFQDGRFGGGVLYPGDRLVNGGPHRNVAGGKVESIRERSIHARYAEPGSMDKALGMIRMEAQRHAPKDEVALDRPAAVELAARVREVVVANSSEAALAQLISYMAERALEDGDDAILREAAEFLGEPAAPRP